MKKAILFAAVAVSLVITGCTAPWTTNTPRSAIEQYLLAITIERMTENAGLEKYKGKKIFFDYNYLATQTDKEYVKGRLEMLMSQQGCLIVAKQEEADVMIQPLCGVLATDFDTFLIGTPPLPIPVAYTDLNIVIPEIPIFKLYNRRAHGRMAFNIFDAKTRKCIDTIPFVNASTFYKNWIILLIPFRTYNFSMDPAKTYGHDVEFIP
ncbi:MAG: hypothetical protein IJS14_11810 [Lentisphaeria bacterium]|nr:hypothetical protein [Lentisphaeria bacterium]